MSGTELGLIVVAAGLVAGAVLRRRLRVITVRGQSMTPTYRDGDRLLVSRPGRLDSRDFGLVAKRYGESLAADRGAVLGVVLRKLATRPDERPAEGGE